MSVLVISVSKIIMILYNFKNKTNLFSVYRQETDAATEEQSTFLAYDKRVKELAQELTESQVTKPLYLFDL